MALGKKATPMNSSRAKVTPPNDSHPCAARIPAVLSPTRPHALNYHSFITSPYLNTNTRLKDELSPPKKRVKTASAPVETVPMPLQDSNPIPVKILHERLLNWFDKEKDTRAMPWRKDVDIDTMTKEERTQRGYEVWVSEIMLQQTQVATVIPYWQKWMARFPTVKQLADSDIEAVNERWTGLGYYSRAARLLAGAKTVMNEFGGEIPTTAVDLEKIDGIGPYSAGSISSIAFAKRSAMVDGNVTRVLSRLTALHAPASAKSTTSFIWALADILVPGKADTSLPGGRNKPGAWNQALMELGASICSPKNPDCAQCPLNEQCLAYAEVRYAAAHRGKKIESELIDLEDLCTLCAPIEEFSLANHAVTQFPMAKERKKPRQEETAVCVLEWQSSQNLNEEKQILLVKRPEKGLLAGLFEFPAIDLPACTELSSTSSRRQAILPIINSLLVEKIPFSSTIADSNSLKIQSNEDLAPVVQVYSHQIRTYHSTRIVLTSETLPKLNLKSSNLVAEDVAQSLPGRQKWVPESQVASSNIGGAVVKIWQERELCRKGLPQVKKSINGKKGESTTTTKANKRSAADPTQEKDAKKNFLSMFSGASKPKPSTQQSAAIIEERKNLQPAPEEEIIIVHAESPSKVYKKRVIRIASDEESD